MGSNRLEDQTTKREKKKKKKRNTEDSHVHHVLPEQNIPIDADSHPHRQKVLEHPPNKQQSSSPFQPQ